MMGSLPLLEDIGIGLEGLTRMDWSGRRCRSSDEGSSPTSSCVSKPKHMWYSVSVTHQVCDGTYCLHWFFELSHSLRKVGRGTNSKYYRGGVNPWDKGSVPVLF